MANAHMRTDPEIDAYKKRHPSGTKARLALALLLYTAQRRGDVMGWQHLKEGRLRVAQNKTGAELELKLHPDLEIELSVLAKDNLTFLTTEYGAPFSEAGFGNWFRDRCNEAGLTGCSAHGLRKAAARQVAEAGMSADIIKSVTGHTNLKTLSIYTNAADQKRLSDMGIVAIGGSESEHNLTNPKIKLDKKGAK
ncbi:integrase [Paenochrobactrum gallinarii]|uniref:Integrase n=1 Tax=Paenochrobactrum gallinarii TaxID=643673 RepID=A0A841M472_9HYPH|nr:tyrosine-type recombinase/integrase [Paenochrobactrum gallinarii]MBB6262569.1 integrase [Paenochrobactrum gallinarii]